MTDHGGDVPGFPDITVDDLLSLQTLEVLHLRQRQSPTAERAAAISGRTAALALGPPSGESDLLVRRTSLGDADAVTHRLRASSEDVAEILARAERITGRRAADGSPTAVAGPIEEWFREVGQLLAVSHHEHVRDKLEVLGIFLGSDELAAKLTARPVCPDRDLARAVVEVLGKDWIGGGYKACYDAAAAEQRRLDGRTGTTEGGLVSGITGARALTPTGLAQQVRPPYPRRPERVRGREELIRDLTGRLSRPGDAPVVLAGPGGVGKRTVALKVAATAELRGDHVWWVPARDRIQLRHGMLAVAAHLGASFAELSLIQSAPEDNAELLWHLMDNSPTRWLLVLDDVPDPEVLAVPGSRWPHQPWLRPSPAGAILLTTRLTDTGRWNPADVVLVEDLPPADGALVVLDQLATGPADIVRAEDAVTVAELLAGVPFALRVVGAVLSPPDGRSSLADAARELAADRSPGRMGAACRLALADLERRGLGHAHTLLRLLAHYAPHWVVPLDVVAPDRLARCGLPSPACVGGADAWGAALDGLVAVGLVERRSAPGEGVQGVVVHPMVAERARSGGGSDTVQAAAVRLLLDATDGLEPGAPASWPALRRLEPHVYALLDNMRTGRFAVQAAALDLAVRVAEGLIRAGMFTLGEELVRHARTRLAAVSPDAPQGLAAEQALSFSLACRGELTEAQERTSALLSAYRAHDPHGPDHLAVRAQLAWIHGEQGRIDEAHWELQELRRDCEERLGREHRTTLTVLHRLAWVTALRGRPDSAIRQLEALLPRRIAALGQAHMDVFSTRYRLAWARASRCHFAQAEAELVALLADMKTVLDDDSGVVTVVYRRLGHIRTCVGRFAEAESDLHHALDVYSHSFGPTHARTLAARYDLAWCQIRSGNFRKAERMLRGVLTEIDHLGSEHPLSLDTRGRLTQLLVELGRLDEAERSARALFALRAAVSGADHPATLQTRHTLAVTLLKRGKYAEAEHHLARLLDDQEGRLGRTHRHTLRTRRTLVELAARRGNLAGAHEGALDLLACSTRILGQDHKDTLDARALLVGVLTGMDWLAEAEDACHGLIADVSRVLGPMHPQTLKARQQMAWIHSRAGCGAEAFQAFENVLRDQLRTLGPQHPDTLISRHGLAREMVRAEQYDLAEAELRGVLLEHIQLVGHMHPDTLASRHLHALVLALQGRPAEAEQLMERVLHDQLQSLGPDHRSTLHTRERLYWIRERRGTLQNPTALWQELLDDRERLMGAEHPETRRIRARLDAAGHEVPHMW